MTTIRAARDEDLDALITLMHAHASYEHAPAPPASLPETVAVWLRDPHGARVELIVADRNGEVLGYASWSREASTWRGADYGHMDCLFVRDDARGEGLGTLLLHGVMEAVRTAGLTELQWQTPAWNDDAIRFYRRHAAVPVPKMRFTLPL